MNPGKMAKIESAIRVVLEFNAAFNHHDVEAMMKLISDDCTFESAAPFPDGTVYMGKEAITRYWQAFFRESPQAHMEIEEIFGFGRRCILRWKYHKLDADGNKGHVRGVDIFQVSEDMIYEKFSYTKG